MSGGVLAWTAALNRSVLAAPDGSSSKVSWKPFSFETAVNRSFIRLVTAGSMSSGIQTTTGPLAAGFASAAGLAAAAGADVAAAGAAGLAASAGLDASAGLAGAAVGAVGVADELQAARID